MAPRRLASVRNAATPRLTVSFANSTGTFSIRSGTDFGSGIQTAAVAGKLPVAHYDLPVKHSSRQQTL